MAIIPLGPGSLRDSSSLPEGQSAPLLRAKRMRAGPALPSYLTLLHAGFSVPRMSPPGRWALTPPFHPCQMRSTERGEPPVLPKACRRGASITGGIFSVALSVAAPQDTLSRTSLRNPLALPGALPCRGRLLRVHHDWSPDFPPARSAFAKQAGDHPTHPPIIIIRYSATRYFSVCSAVFRTGIRQGWAPSGIWLCRISSRGRRRQRRSWSSY